MMSSSLPQEQQQQEPDHKNDGRSTSGSEDDNNNDDDDVQQQQQQQQRLEEGEGTMNSNKKRPSPSLQDAITADGERPQKKFYRQRAHCNPLSHNDSFNYPVSPNQIDWTIDHYPGLKHSSNNSKNNDPSIIVRPNVLDVGCGFGGLTLALATLLPPSDNNVILGLEIRAKVTEYVRLRIMNARKENPDNNNKYQNCSVLRSNSMKHLVNYFAKASINKLFFCFPDPHFKRKNHPRRIVNRRLLSQYAYVLKPGIGKLYCITDVKELHDWHIQECDAHPLFRRLSQNEIENDPCVDAMKTETEEGKKVSRSGGSKYYAVYERILDTDAAIVHADNFFL